MVGHRIDVLEESTAGTDIRFHGFNRMREKFPEIIVKFRANIGTFDFELPDQPV